jgi:D-alanyl-D-alanine dipeptidase
MLILVSVSSEVVREYQESAAEHWVVHATLAWRERPRHDGNFHNGGSAVDDRLASVQRGAAKSIELMGTLLDDMPAAAAGSAIFQEIRWSSLSAKYGEKI